MIAVRRPSEATGSRATSQDGRGVCPALGATTSSSGTDAVVELYGQGGAALAVMQAEDRDPGAVQLGQLDHGRGQDTQAAGAG